jgi:hypothetical protein
MRSLSLNGTTSTAKYDVRRKRFCAPAEVPVKEEGRDVLETTFSLVPFSFST